MADTKKTKKNAEAWMFDVLKQPCITEKATLVAEAGQVVFNVDPQATKPKVKAAVEGVYGVEVKAVNILVSKGKTKRFRGIMGKRKDVKKAYVTLADGQNLDFSA